MVVELVEQLLSGGCVVSTITARGIKSEAYELDGFLVARTCTKCRQIKRRDCFDLQKSSRGGIYPSCKECCSQRKKERYKDPEVREDSLVRIRKYYEDNRTEILVQKQGYYEGNKDVLLEKMRRWERANRPVRKVIGQRYRTRKESLPSTLTSQEDEYARYFFGNSCALTGETEGIHMDHVVPISIGRGGTVIGNWVPMLGKLNQSKNSRNIFVWFEDNKERFGLPQYKFDIMVEYLADLNRMTPQEYRDYVYSCYEERTERFDD